MPKAPPKTKEKKPAVAKAQSWFVYILKCSDNSLYTGVTTDTDRRVSEHNSDTKGAKYTKARQPVALVYSETQPDRSSAQIREAAIKKLSKPEKLRLVQS